LPEVKEKNQDTPSIAPADGKLGVLIPGIGAVSTTFIAGVEAIKRGLAQPIGSLTQLATIRLGKRTDANTPKIKDFVPLAGLDDLVFGGWDIYDDNAYEAAAHANVLEPNLLEKVRMPLEKIKPMPAVFEKEYVKRIDGPNVKKGSKMDRAQMLIDDIAKFRKEKFKFISKKTTFMKKWTRLQSMPSRWRSRQARPFRTGGAWPPMSVRWRHRWDPWSAI